MAFDGGPFATSYTWTDVTDRVTDLKVRRGRNDELNRIEAGTLSLTLDNNDGRFTPGREILAELLPDNVRTGSDTLGTTSGFNVGAGVTVTSGTNNPHSGARAIQILASNTGNISLLFTNNIPVTAGKTYSGSYWIRKTTTGGNADVPTSAILRWRDASGAFISDTNGMAIDGTSSSWTKCAAVGTAPVGATTATLIVHQDVAVGSAWVYWCDDFSLAEVNPNYPNVIPRRRVRVRTANLLPKDTATGGDVTRSTDAFTVSQAGGSVAWGTANAKSGAGAIRANMGNNGTADWASSLWCGRSKTYTTGWTWWPKIVNVPTGLAKVVPGASYTASGQVMLATGSPATKIRARIRWYKADGTFNNSSGSTGQITLVNGSYVSFSVTGVCPAGVAWAGIEIGTSGGDNNASLFVDEVQLEAASSASAWTPGGSVFFGYIESWAVQLDTLVSTCAVTATDGFSVLGTTELRTPYQQAVLASFPVGYWPLTDTAGITKVANAYDDTMSGALVASKYGGATPAFGAASVLAKETDTAYSLGNIASNKGTVVDLNDGGKRSYTLGSSLSVAFWSLPVRPSAGYVTLFQAWDDSARRLVSFRLSAAGDLECEVGWADGTSAVVASSAGSALLSTSVPSFICATVSNGSFTLFVNGASMDSDSAGGSPDLRDMKWSSLAGQQAGGIYTEYANGRYGHVSIWDRALSASEITDLWSLGSNGGSDYPEPEADRLSRLASYAGFQGELSLDPSLSTLMAPTWEAATTALDVIQSAAEDASGYVFVDGDGRLTYHNRARRQSAPIRYTLGESNGLPFEPGLTFQMDDDKVINEVNYTRTGGVSATVRDSTSIAAFGRKSKSLELSITDDMAVSDAAYSLLNVYAEPIVRCEQVNLNATATNGLFPVALGVEVGDRVKLTDLPAGAPAPNYEFYVEAIDTAVSVDGATAQWVTTLSLSPATASDVWVVEDATNGVLDATTILAY
jgi:hypothetical protein